MNGNNIPQRWLDQWDRERGFKQDDPAPGDMPEWMRAMVEREFGK